VPIPRAEKPGGTVPSPFGLGAGVGIRIVLPRSPIRYPDGPYYSATERPCQRHATIRPGSGGREGHAGSRIADLMPVPTGGKPRRARRRSRGSSGAPEEGFPRSLLDIGLEQCQNTRMPFYSQMNVWRVPARSDGFSPVRAREIEEAFIGLRVARSNGYPQPIPR
jgi:hypothetical protein